MVAGFLHGIPEIRYEGKYFHQGADQLSYFVMAKSFVDLKPVKTFFPVGFPLILTPFVIVNGANEWEDIARPVLYFHSGLAFLSIFIIGYLTFFLTGRTLISAAAAFLWAIHPYLMYAAFGLHPNARILRTIYVDHAMWFPMLSDPSSVFFVLLATLLFFKSITQKKYVYFSALCIGTAMLIRLPNIVICGILGAGYFFKKEFSAAVKFGLCSLLVFLPQLFYNYYCYGSMFDFGSEARFVADSHRITVVFGVENLIAYAQLLGGKYSLFTWSMISAGLLVPFTVIYLRKSQRFSWVIITVLITGYVLFYLTWWGFKYFPYRFIMPVIPLSIIVMVDLCSIIMQVFSKGLLWFKR